LVHDFTSTVSFALSVSVELNMLSECNSR
jgi:hypothetical protein